MSEEGTEKSGYKYLWVYKFRPNTLAHIILPPKPKKMFKSFVDEKHIPNLFFHSSTPGTGKTTVARALMNDCGYEYKYINASKDNGIDTVRTQIVRYVSSYGFDNKPKCVILDEFDGASFQFQQAMRALIDEHNDCRFIIICNYAHKLIEPLVSRLQEVNFDYADEKTVEFLLPRIQKHIKALLTHEKIKFEEATIDTFVKNLYPDIRRMLNTLQGFSKQNDVISDDIFNYQTINDEFIELIIEKKYSAVRQYVIDKGYDYDELYGLLFEHLIPKISELSKSVAAECIVDLAKYSDMSVRAPNKELVFCACVLTIISNLSDIE